MSRTPALGLAAIALAIVVAVVLAVSGSTSPTSGPVSPSHTPSPSPSPSAAGPSSPSPSPSAGPSSPGPSASPAIAPSASPSPATSAIRPGSVDRSSLNVTATYDVSLRVDWVTRRVVAATTITVTNTSGAPIDRLELNTIAARLGGAFTIRSATVDGAPVRPTVDDQTILLPLGGILDPGAGAVVKLTYRATLRSTTSGSTWLFTRANGILEAHRWIPWISRATPFDRPNHGDPFVTPVASSVRVRIISDRVISWATTGEQIGPTDRDISFEATNVRDFAIVGAPDFRTTSATVGKVVIRVKSRPGFAASAVLAAAKRALSKEAALLGAYPYRTYDLAQTAGGYGMESPGLTWIPTGAGNLTYLVAHETAHQWFYGIVGNDQARNPYADEAAADQVARYVTGLRRGSRCATARLDLSIYRYSSACYYETVYIQGGNLLDDIRRSMGNARYWSTIRDYLDANRFRLSTTKRLLETLDAATSLDLAARYRNRFPSIL